MDKHAHHHTHADQGRPPDQVHFHDRRHGHQQGDQAELKDPVCGMTVTQQSPHHLEHAGRPFWFCSAGCKDKFAADPLRYAGAAHAPAPVAAELESAIYTCPMHPEIRQSQPGNCPKCGMALGPLLPDLDAEERTSKLGDVWHTQALPFLYAAFGIVIIALADHDTSTARGVTVMIISGVIGVLFILFGIVSWANRRRRLRETSRSRRH